MQLGETDRSQTVTSCGISSVCDWKSVVPILFVFFDYSMCIYIYVCERELYMYYIHLPVFYFDNAVLLRNHLNLMDFK